MHRNEKDEEDRLAKDGQHFWCTLLCACVLSRGMARSFPHPFTDAARAHGTFAVRFKRKMSPSGLLLKDLSSLNEGFFCSDAIHGIHSIHPSGCCRVRLGVPAEVAQTSSSCCLLLIGNKKHFIFVLNGFK